MLPRSSSKLLSNNKESTERLQQPTTTDRPQKPPSNSARKSLQVLVKASYNRFFDDMELEFGPGIVDRLKSKFASASSLSASYAVQQATSGREQKSFLFMSGCKEPSSTASSSPTSSSSSSGSTAASHKSGAFSNNNNNMATTAAAITTSRKLDGILSQKLLMNDNVIIIDRAGPLNGVYPPHNNSNHAAASNSSHALFHGGHGTAAAAQPGSSVKLNNNNYNSLGVELVNKSECIEGLVSQYKAIFEKEQPLYASAAASPQRRKRSKDQELTASVSVSLSSSTTTTSPPKPELPVVLPLPPPLPLTPIPPLLAMTVAPVAVNLVPRENQISSPPQPPPRPLRELRKAQQENNARTLPSSPKSEVPKVPPRPAPISVSNADLSTISVVKPIPHEVPKDFKRNHAASMPSSSPEFNKRTSVTQDVVPRTTRSSPAESDKTSRPEKVPKTSSNGISRGDAEKENTTPVVQRVALKKAASYGMTTIIDTKSKPIEPAIPALKIDDPALLTSLKDLGRSRSSADGSDVRDGGEIDIDIETLKIVIVGYNVPTGSKSSLKSSSTITSRRSHLRITFNDDATETYEYPSERSLISVGLDAARSGPTSTSILSLDAEIDESDTDGVMSLSSSCSDSDTVVTSVPAREGDLLRKPVGITKALSSYKPTLTSQFQLGLERPSYTETAHLPSNEAAPSSPGTPAATTGSRPLVMPLQQQRQPLQNGNQRDSADRHEQWCVPSAADVGNFSNTASDADDLLF